MRCDKCGSELTTEQELNMLRKRVEELENELKLRPVISYPYPVIERQPYQPYAEITYRSSDSPVERIGRVYLLANS